MLIYISIPCSIQIAIMNPLWLVETCWINPSVDFAIANTWEWLTFRYWLVKSSDRFSSNNYTIHWELCIKMGMSWALLLYERYRSSGACLIVSGPAVQMVTDCRKGLLERFESREREAPVLLTKRCLSSLTRDMSSTSWRLRSSCCAREDKLPTAWQA